ALNAGVATGFQFSPVDGPALQHALSRAARVHADAKAWSSMQRRGMETDVSWDRSAARYADLYRTLIAA
ncbi:MAG: glycogen synthase GlgA, partial [Aestuariivirga sp.]